VAEKKQTWNFTAIGCDSNDVSKYLDFFDTYEEATEYQRNAETIGWRRISVFDAYLNEVKPHPSQTELKSFHLGDSVEVIATRRQGTIVGSRKDGDIIVCWDVLFPDGTRHFPKSVELHLINCPHSEPEPGLVPERGII
jgi:hypothetical protein